MEKLSVWLSRFVSERWMMVSGTSAHLVLLFILFAFSSSHAVAQNKTADDPSCSAVAPPLNQIGLIKDLSSAYIKDSKNPKVGEKCPAPWTCGFLPWKATTGPIIEGDPLGLGKTDVDVQIRAGYLPENPDPKVPFKGDIIYYEGLGDSMLNHMPLFNKLTAQGYRVIAFDYMGQGGSTGNMSDTRIKDIPKIADLVWNTFAKEKTASKTIIGWSTGGLAAFNQALNYPDQVKKLVAIAPGIEPKMHVGKITLASLTRDQYSKTNPNPHVDPIYPTSPMAVMSFTTNLMDDSMVTRNSELDPKTKGLVLLSDENDSYVDADKTVNYLSAHAKNIQHIPYPGTLHEIDNEVEKSRDKAHADILKFLNQ